MSEERAPNGAVSITSLRRLGLNCHYCGKGKTARYKVQYESGRTRKIDHSRTVFVCGKHLPSDNNGPQGLRDLLTFSLMADLSITPPGTLSAELMERVERKIDECMAMIPQPITRPFVVYDLRGKHAGYANRNRIRLNVDLLNDPRYVDSMIDDAFQVSPCD